MGSEHGTRFLLRHTHPRKLFGTSGVWRSRSRVMVSDIHRTIVDMLDNPAVGRSRSTPIRDLQALPTIEPLDPLPVHVVEGFPPKSCQSAGPSLTDRLRLVPCQSPVSPTTENPVTDQTGEGSLTAPDRRASFCGIGGAVRPE